MSRRRTSASTTSSASSPTASSRSRWATSSRPRRSATPASRRTPSAPTRTEDQGRGTRNGLLTHAPRSELRDAIGPRLWPARSAIDVSEAVCKPSSVPPRAEARVGDGHPSVAAGCPAALAAYPRAGQRTSPPNRSPGTGCALLFGLAPGGVCRVSLRRPTRKPVGGIVTVALVLVSRRTGVTRHPALRSSDFPHEIAGSLRRSRATIRPPR